MQVSGREVGAVATYYAYKATKAVEFYRPIMYVFFLSRGVSFTGIAAMELVYNVTTVVAEVPTGYVGDRVGRRNALAIGTALIVVALVGLGSSHSLPAFLGFYVVWSTGYTFRSGTEDAWLYDTLTARLDEGSFSRVRGRGESVSLFTGVVAAVVGGYLADISLAYPFFVAAGVTAVGIPLLLVLPEPDVTEGVDVLSPREALRVAREAIAQPHVRSFVVLYYVLVSSALYLAFVFLQPVVTDVLATVGVPDARIGSALGWYYAAISLVGALLSYHAGRIENAVGRKAWFYALPVVVACVYVGLYYVPLLAIPGLLLVRSVGDVTRTFAAGYVNDRIGSVGRATVLSAMSMVGSLAVAPLQFAGGVVSDLASPAFAFAAGGVCLLVGAVVIALVESPFAGESTTA